MSEKVKLLPCPFCLDEAIATYSDGRFWHVSCSNCCARGSVSYTEDEAREKWNKRA